MSAGYALISSRANEKIKRLVRLGDKKAREEEGVFLLEGFKLAREYFEKVGIPDEIYVREDALDKFSPPADMPAEKITCVTASVYDKISEEKAPQGILLVSPRLKNVSSYDGDARGGVMLESIRDSGNLGTIIRTAAALGITRIYLGADCADIYSRKTLRAAMGAVFSADIRICAELTEAACDIKKAGGRVFAAMPRGGAEALGRVRFTRRDCVAFGNEGAGISDRLASVCEALTIPMSDGAESLNAAAAAALIIWEMSGRGSPATL